MSRTSKGAPPPGLSHECSAMLFAFRLFSFVITDAGTQLRKYLAGSDVCTRQPSRIFLFNDCAFCLLASAWIFVRIHECGSVGYRGFYRIANTRRFRAEIASCGTKFFFPPHFGFIVGRSFIGMPTWTMVVFSAWSRTLLSLVAFVLSNINIINWRIYRITTFYLYIRIDYVVFYYCNISYIGEC